jgi:integrase
VAQRRGHHEGGIAKRRNADGKVVGYQVQVRLPDGTRKTVGTVATKREAVALAQLRQVDVTAGRLSSSPRQTLGAYLADWLETKRSTIRYKTYVTYRTVVRHATGVIGQTQLDAVRPTHIERCEREIGTSKGMRTAQQVHTMLHGALGRAVQLDLISRNPVDAVATPRAVPAERPTLTLDQARDFFEATTDEQLYPLYVILVTTGMRLGEALGLPWRYVNFDDEMLLMRQAIQRQTGKGFVVEELKSKKSRRLVPLMKVAVEALRMQQDRQSKARSLPHTDWHDTDFVFTSDVGTPLDPANVRRSFYKALDWTDMPRVRLHDLRHTASTLMATQKIPLHVIQAVLGHATSATTADIYTHVLPSSYEELKERMNAAYARVTAEPA